MLALPSVSSTTATSRYLRDAALLYTRFNIIMSSPRYTVRYFDDGSKHSVPRDSIVVSTVESAAGDSSDPQTSDLPIGCFVVVDGREAVVVPGPTKRPRGIG